MNTRQNRDPQLISRENTLLAVVDVQERLYPHIAGNEAMRVEIARLIRFAAIVGLPVVHVEQEKLGPTIESLAVLLGEDKAAVKQTFGSFGCAGFVESLANRRFDTLVLTGIETHVCVLQTAFGALQRGLRVQVVADAVGSRSPCNKETALARMRAAGVEVTCAESFIFEIMGRSGTEEFRRVLELLKS